MSGRSAIQICATAWICIACLSNADAAASTHLRFDTVNGPIHVWTPAKYDADSAGVIVYVHGFYTNVDHAWRRHRLPDQFAASAINALFIACEAPKGPRDDVRWVSLRELLDTVAKHVDLPSGRIIVVGHSGAHRTILPWLGEDIVDTIVLVDALFEDNPLLRAWLDTSSEHRLIDAAADTRPWTEALHAQLPDTLVFDRFPPPKAGRLRGARDARIVYVRSQHDHMSLVTGGIAIPLLLRTLQLPVVKHASRRTPIHPF